MHGGIESNGFLTPSILEEAERLWQYHGDSHLDYPVRREKGLTDFGAVQIMDLSDRDILKNLGIEKIGDNGIPVYSYEDFRNKGQLSHKFGYAVIRNLDEVHKENNPENHFIRLTSPDGIVINSQIIVDAGGVSEAQRFVDFLKNANGITQGYFQYNPINFTAPANLAGVSDGYGTYRSISRGGLYRNYVSIRSKSFVARFVVVTAAEYEQSENPAGLFRRTKRIPVEEKRNGLLRALDKLYQS